MKKQLKMNMIKSGVIWLPGVLMAMYILVNIYIDAVGGGIHLSVYGHGLVWMTAVLCTAAIAIKNVIDYVFYGKKEFSCIRDYLFTKKYSRERKVAMFPRIPDNLLYIEPKGIVLGCMGSGIFKRYICIDVEDRHISNHIVVFGNTGAGKSSLMLSSLIPNFMKENTSPPITFLTIDVKPELAELSNSNDRYARVLNPLERDSWGWDVYWNISKESSEDEIYDAIQTIAKVLIPDAEEKNAFFTNNARNLVCGVLMFEFITFHRNFIQSMKILLHSEVEEYVKSIKKMVNAKSKVHMLLAEFGEDKSNAWADIKKTLKQDFGVFVKDNTEWFLDSDVNRRVCNPKNLDNGISLFLSIPRSDLENYGVIFRLIVSQCMDLLSRRKDNDPNKKQVVLLLDELPNLGARLPSYTANLGFIRSKKVTCISIIQQYSKLQSVYGKEEAKTIINMGHQLILSCEDNELGRIFCDKGGEFQETKVDYKRTGIFLKRKVDVESVSKISSRRIRVMDDLSSLVTRFEAIAFINGSQYYRFDKCRYYLEPILNKRAEECEKINQAKREGYTQEV